MGIPVLVTRYLHTELAPSVCTMDYMDQWVKYQIITILASLLSLLYSISTNQPIKRNDFGTQNDRQGLSYLS